MRSSSFLTIGVLTLVAISILTDPALAIRKKSRQGSEDEEGDASPKNTRPLSANPALSPEMKEFWTWIEGLGTDTTRLSMKPLGNTGWGLFAEEDIPPLDPMIVIPEKSVMTSETAKKSEIYPYFENEGLDLETTLFAVHVVKELSKGDKSFWAPYLKVIPRKFDSAIFFTDEEMSQLTGCNVQEVVNGINTWMDYTFENKLMPIFNTDRNMFPSKWFTYDNFRVAVGLIYTRCFDFHKSWGTLRVMTPAIDFINHDWVESNVNYSDDGQQLSVKVGHAIKAGDQLSISYGKKSNSDLLLMYGFTMDPNPHDTYKINIQLHDTDPLYKQKVEIFTAMGLTPRNDFPLSAKNINRDILRAIRTNVLSPEELVYKSAVIGYSPVSLRSELKVLDLLGNALRGILNNFPTTAGEDEKLLASSNDGADLAWRLNQAIRTRLSEKRVIAKNIEMIAEYRARIEADPTLADPPADISLVDKLTEEIQFLKRENAELKAKLGM